MATDGDLELDYHVTFPSPALHDAQEEELYDSDDSFKEKKEPVVVLLGWMGCQDKHLTKYSAFYESKGCTTIRYTAPTHEIFPGAKRTASLPVIAFKILELLTDLSLDENPVLFHVFSNGGGMVYHNISSILCNGTVKEFNNINVIGCIFDSCPSQRSITTAVRAFVATLSQPAIIRYIIGFFFLFYMIGFYALSKIKSTFQMSVPQMDYWSYMLNEPARWPQMYLYSKKDHLISYKYVDYVVASRRKLGVDVSSHCWEDTAHVQHFRKHREAYINLCHDFLKSCLSKTD